MNLNIFIQTILNFSIELVIICIIAFAFLQSKLDLSFIRLSLSSIFLLSNIILETYLNNHILFHTNFNVQYFSYYTYYNS